MITVGDSFKNKINKGIAKIVNYADITLSDGTVLNLTPSDILVGGCTITDKSTTGSKFMIGTANAKTLTLQISNHDDKFSQYNFYNSTVFVYIKDAEDEEGEKVRKGKFYVTSPETGQDVIQITGSDSMILLDQDYTTTLVYPATLQEIASDICSICGVAPGFTTFDNSSFVVSEKPTDCTCREVIKWVAEISGTVARFNHNDYLVFENYTVPDDALIYFGGRFMTDNDTVINGGNFDNYEAENVIFGGDFTDYGDGFAIHNIADLTISTDDVVITGIKVTYDKEEVLKGTDDYAIEVKSNDLSKGRLNDVASYLFEKYGGFTFRPMTVSIIENPLLEPIDGGYVKDYKGNTYLMIINNVSYKVNGYTSIKCEAQDPIRNNAKYVSKSAQAIAKAREEAEQNLTQYDKAVQRMNLLAANSMGFYSTEVIQDDGSRIYYMHSSPELTSSETIYKMTADGFFVSTDGGKSYTAGFDAEGNAVLNILSVIGISFNWAKGGKLTLGGQDNVNGELIMLNAFGSQYGKWDKESLNIGGTYGFDATSSQIQIGGSNGLVGTSSQIQIGGTFGLIGTSSQIQIGGTNGIIATSSQIQIGGSSGFVATSSKITIGGSYGLEATSSELKIGGTNGLSATSSGIKIGGTNGISITSSKITIGDSYGLTAESGKITIGGSYGMVANSSGVTIGGSYYNVAITSSSVTIGGTNGVSIKSSGISIGGSTGSITIGGTNGISITSSKISMGYSYYTVEMTSSGISIGGTYGTDITSSGMTTKGSFAHQGTSLGFFSHSTSSKTSVSQMSSYGTPTVTELRDKLNALIGALNSYGIV